MCIIIDNNVCGLFFRPSNEDFAPVWKWLKKDGRLVFGGKLKDELVTNHAARRLLAELLRSGKAYEYTDEQLAATIQGIESQCRSNDAHVLALAIVSKARVLATHDQELTEDFKDVAMIPAPKGRIYKRRTHKSLLNHHDGCKPRI